MGTLQLSELREEVHSAFADRTDLTNARIDRIINMSQDRIARRYRLDDLITEATIDIASNEETLPADVHKLYHLSIRNKADTGGYTSDLTRVTKKKLLQLHQMKATPDKRRPSIYARYGQKLRVHPFPDVTYLGEYVYSKRPTALSADTDTSDFDMMDDAIIALTASWFYSIFGNSEEANRWFRIFRNSMGDAINEDNESPDATIDAETAPNKDIGEPRYYEDPFVKSV